MNTRYFFLAVLVALTSMVSAQSLAGRWKTIDDETGRVKSVVEMSERDGQFFGTVVELFRLPEEGNHTG